MSSIRIAGFSKDKLNCSARYAQIYVFAFIFVLLQYFTQNNVVQYGSGYLEFVIPSTATPNTQILFDPNEPILECIKNLMTRFEASMKGTDFDAKIKKNMIPYWTVNTAQPEEHQINPPNFIGLSKEEIGIDINNDYRYYQSNEWFDPMRIKRHRANDYEIKNENSSQKIAVSVHKYRKANGLNLHYGNTIMVPIEYQDIYQSFRFLFNEREYELDDSMADLICKIAPSILKQKSKGANKKYKLKNLNSNFSAKSTQFSQKLSSLYSQRFTNFNRSSYQLEKTGKMNVKYFQLIGIDWKNHLSVKQEIDDTKAPLSLSVKKDNLISDCKKSFNDPSLPFTFINTQKDEMIKTIQYLNIYFGLKYRYKTKSKMWIFHGIFLDEPQKIFSDHLSNKHIQKWMCQSRISEIKLIDNVPPKVQHCTYEETQFKLHQIIQTTHSFVRNICDSIQENIPIEDMRNYIYKCAALSYVIDGSSANLYHLNDSGSDESIQIFNLGLYHKHRNEHIYIVAKTPYQNERNFLSIFENKIFTQQEIKEKYGKQYGITTLPNAPQCDVSFKSDAKIAQRIALFIKQELSENMKGIRWNEMPSYCIKSNLEKVIFEIDQSKFIEYLMQNLTINTEKIKLIPIILFDVNGAYIHYLWRININNNDIAIAFAYDDKTEDIQVKGIHNDKRLISRAHALADPQCSSIDNCWIDSFDSKIDILKITAPHNPDGNIIESKDDRKLINKSKIREDKEHTLDEEKKDNVSDTDPNDDTIWFSACTAEEMAFIANHVCCDDNTTDTIKKHKDLFVEFFKKYPMDGPTFNKLKAKEFGHAVVDYTGNGKLRAASVSLMRAIKGYDVYKVLVPHGIVSNANKDEDSGGIKSMTIVCSPGSGRPKLKGPFSQR